MLSRIAIFLASCAIGSVLSAQIDSNSVTVTASRVANTQPDLVLFSVGVSSGSDVNLSDIVALLQPAGITVANFSGISSSPIFRTGDFTGTPVPAPTIQWTFTLPVPLAKLKDTTTTLTNLQKSIAQKNNSVQLSFNVQGTQVSTQLAAAQPCVLSDLIADARAQAQKMADASGLSLGQILALSSSTSTPVVAANGLSGLLLYQPAVQSACVITVKFGLVRFQ